MQIPLVESRLALSYSSWFSDSEFAFFVRGFGHALFNLEGKAMKKVSSILWGLVLVAAGVIFALNAFNITDIEYSAQVEHLGRLKLNTLVAVG